MKPRFYVTRWSLSWVVPWPRPENWFGPTQKLNWKIGKWAPKCWNYFRLCVLVRHKTIDPIIWAKIECHGHCAHTHTSSAHKLRIAHQGSRINVQTPFKHSVLTPALRAVQIFEHHSGELFKHMYWHWSELLFKRLNTTLGSCSNTCINIVMHL